MQWMGKHNFFFSKRQHPLLRSLGFAFYRGADCCALCFDLTNAQSFEALDKWKEGFIENAGPDDPQSFPFVDSNNPNANDTTTQNDQIVPGTSKQALAKRHTPQTCPETSLCQTKYRFPDALCLNSTSCLIPAMSGEHRVPAPGHRLPLSWLLSSRRFQICRAPPSPAA